MTLLNQVAASPPGKLIPGSFHAPPSSCSAPRISVPPISFANPQTALRTCSERAVPFASQVRPLLALSVEERLNVGETQFRPLGLEGWGHTEAVCSRIVPCWAGDSAMRMRGLEPPRGTEAGGGMCRHVLRRGFPPRFSGSARMAAPTCFPTFGRGLVASGARRREPDVR